MERKKAKTRVVGVDVGLLTTTYAIVDIRGNIIAQESFATGDYPNIDSFVAVLKRILLMEAIFCKTLKHNLEVLNLEV